MEIKFTTFVEVVSVWSIVTVFELPVNVAVIWWSAEPVCVVVMSLLFPVGSKSPSFEYKSDNNSSDFIASTPSAEILPFEIEKTLTF